jgi:hypothetical protein
MCPWWKSEVRIHEREKNIIETFLFYNYIFKIVVTQLAQVWICHKLYFEDFILQYLTYFTTHKNTYQFGP